MKLPELLLMILSVVLVLGGIVLIVFGIISPLSLILSGAVGAVMIFAGVILAFERTGKK